MMFAVKLQSVYKYISLLGRDMDLELAQDLNQEMMDLNYSPKERSPYSLFQKPLMRVFHMFFSFSKLFI